jgi:hypothetical protein
MAEVKLKEYRRVIEESQRRSDSGYAEMIPVVERLKRCSRRARILSNERI